MNGRVRGCRIPKQAKLRITEIIVQKGVVRIASVEVVARGYSSRCTISRHDYA